MGVVVLSLGPTTEVDLFWHIRVGQYTLHGHAFPHPDPFAFTLPSAHWHSTAWLSELVIAAVYGVAGFGGIVALRLLLVLLLLTALFRLLVRDSTGWTGPAVFAILAVPLSEFVQDRPMLASLVFLCWLAGVLDRHLTAHTAPHRLRFVAMTYAWATIHGLFVLAPGFLLLLTVPFLRARDPQRQRAARHATGTALLAVVACALTPMGPRLLLAPVTVGAAARDFIVEWAPTTIMVFGALSLYLLMGLLLLAASRARRPMARLDLFYVVVVSLFGLLAIRNVAPASILLAPVAVRWADAAWNTSSSIVVPWRPLRAVAALALAVSLLGQLGRPAVDEGPRRIADYLSAQPEGTRVLNDYNISGYLLLRAPNIRVAVDGRADRYGSEYLATYAEAVRGAPQWRTWVGSLDAAFAVLPDQSALPELLRTQWQWRRVMKDEHYVLLIAPTARVG